MGCSSSKTLKASTAKPGRKQLKTNMSMGTLAKRVRTIFLWSLHLTTLSRFLPTPHNPPLFLFPPLPHFAHARYDADKIKGGCKNQNGWREALQGKQLVVARWRWSRRTWQHISVTQHFLIKIFVFLKKYFFHVILLFKCIVYIRLIEHEALRLLRKSTHRDLGHARCACCCCWCCVLSNLTNSWLYFIIIKTPFLHLHFARSLRPCCSASF